MEFEPGSEEKHDIWRPYPLDINKEDCGYITEKVLGSGTFGKVSSVYRDIDEERYALKEIKLNKSSKESLHFSLGLSLVEAMIISSSDHPNIIKARDIFFECDTSINFKKPRIRMLLEKGDGDLYSITNYLLEDKLKIFYQLAKGLDFLHSHNIIHADFKPENVIMFGNTPKISDFGLSTFSLVENTDPVHSIKFLGTPNYIAPELYLQNGKYNNKIDIWSYGVSLLEILLLDGKKLFIPDIEKQDIIINIMMYIRNNDEYLYDNFNIKTELFNNKKKFILKLANLCLNPDKNKRISAYEICEYIEDFIEKHNVEEFDIKGLWLNNEDKFNRQKTIDYINHISGSEIIIPDYLDDEYSIHNTAFVQIASVLFKYKPSSVLNNINVKDLLKISKSLTLLICNKNNISEYNIFNIIDTEKILRFISILCDKTKFRFFNPAL